MGESAAEANAQAPHLYDPDQEQVRYRIEHPDDDYRCDHFDCACPTFVVDGRVTTREWDIYVRNMGITYEEQANAKVAHQHGLDDEQDSDLPLFERGDITFEGPRDIFRTPDGQPITDEQLTHALDSRLSKVPTMTTPTRPLIGLGGLPARLDNHLNTVGDSPEDRASSWAAAVVPTMRAVSDELYERYLQVREVVGNVDGMLLAAQTVMDLADALVVDYGIEESLTADQQ